VAPRNGNLLAKRVKPIKFVCRHIAERINQGVDEDTQIMAAETGGQ
jgi:hypothetical protein